MFDAIVKAKRYEEALAELSKPEYEDKEIFLHDYHEPCYRTDKNYTLNGLHWGYPDSVCACVLGVDPESNLTAKDYHQETIKGSGGYYASFVTGDPKYDKRYSDNSRFVKVRYGDAKSIIERGIKQKLAKAKQEAKKEVKALADWKKTVKKNYGQYLPAAIRIDFKDDTFTITALDPSRFNRYGFGSFLENIKKGEVSISQAAFDKLKYCPERRGLMGIDIHANPLMINYGFAGTQLDVPEEDVSVMNGAWEKLRKLVVVKD